MESVCTSITKMQKGSRTKVLSADIYIDWRKALKMLKENPFNEWLERTIKDVFDMEPRAMCMACILENGDVYTSYYEMNATDKAIVVHNINVDIIMNVIEANREEIIEIIEDDEDMEGDEKIEED